VREAIQRARQRGGLNATGQVERFIRTERYLSVEALDALYDEALNVVRAELPRKGVNKAALATALVTLGDAKIRVRQLAYVARANLRLREPTEVAG
jgi:hypothetical protein